MKARPKALEDFPGSIQALSPISHIGDEKTGSTPVLRSMLHWDPETNAHVRIPFLSGNAVRGFCRRLIVHDLLDTVGYDLQAKRLWHFLMSGGNLESTDETSGAIDLAVRRWLRVALPHVGLMGGSIGNQIVDGSLHVDHAMPVCREYRHYLRPDLQADSRSERPVNTFTDYAFFTRHDDLRAEREEDEAATQMKVEVQVFQSGARFQHGFRLVHATPMERACLGRLLELWAERGTIGGMSAKGMGRIRVEYRDPPDSGIYRSYLEGEAEAVRAALDKVAGILEPRRRLA